MKPGLRRLRLGIVLLLLPAWAMRWTTAQTEVGVAVQHGPERTGAVGAAILLVLWGLAATSLLARTGGARVRGTAVTDVLLTGAVTACLLLVPMWCGGGSRLEEVFALLLLLALLQALVPGRDAKVSRDVALIRGLAAALVAVVLVLDSSWLAGGLAAWISVSSLTQGLMTARGGARRKVEALLLLASLAALLTPSISVALETQAIERQGVYGGQYVWTILSAMLVFIALHGVVRPKGLDPPRIASPGRPGVGWPA